jgi:alpha-galactosidase
MGFDFLKYDWCSYGSVAGGRDREHLLRPYKLMSGELRKQPRDIVLNLCQYGMGSVWEWGATVGNCWRTTGDLGLSKGAELPGFYSIGMSNAKHWSFAKPGGWNDPDYLLIGWVGNAHGMQEGKPTTLNPNEQYSYMSMWALMAAPLIFSGDMEKLDPFTLNILCNAEVIDIDQDPLGKQGRIVRQNRNEFILAKPLADGSTAVGLFNLAPTPRKMTVTLVDLGIDGPVATRDPWRQQALGILTGSVTTTVPRHGVQLVRLTPKKSPE